MRMNIFIVLCVGAFLSCKNRPVQIPHSNDKLIRKRDAKNSHWAYYNQNNEKVLGDYWSAFSDTITDFGIVSDPDDVLIDRTGKHIYKIFRIDNGPDYTAEGYYRIVGENGKIGYVDSLSSTLIIQPTFDCAYPFENGKAKVSNDCKTVYDGEYQKWESQDWYYIDKKGNKIE